MAPFLSAIPDTLLNIFSLLFFWTEGVSMLRSGKYRYIDIELHCDEPSGFSKGMNNIPLGVIL